MDKANRIEIFKSMMLCLDDPEIPEKLEEWGFFDAPASTKYLGMFHDLCKIDQYRHPVTGRIIDGDKYCPVYDEQSWEYNTETLLKGHGDKSVMRCASLLQLTEEEVMCIRYHMGAFTDKEEWQDYTRAIHRYPNVLWTHQADMIAAHIKGL